VSGGCWVSSGKSTYGRVGGVSVSVIGERRCWIRRWVILTGSHMNGLTAMNALFAI
jgi:hypothetical protein